jgi:hypothetical protein
MQQLLLQLCGAIAFLFLTTGSSAQNVGIGTNNPQQKLHVQGNTYIKDSLGIRITRPLATLDVNGTVLFRGNNNNNFDDSIRAAVEFFTGRGDLNNVPFGNTMSDIAFNFGGPGGGFRHFLITRHSTSLNAAQNAIDFYINKSSVDTGSFAPDSGNVRALTITDAGVYITDRLAIGTNNTPNEKFYVNGNAKVETDFLVGGSSVLNNKVNILDRLAIGTSNTPTERFYVNGNAKVETDFLVGGSSILNNKVNILDRLAIGTSNTPTEKLYVNGSAKVETDLSVTGTVNMGYTTNSQEFISQGNTINTYTLSCAAGQRLIYGGGGHRDYNLAAQYVIINYNGPDITNPTTTWRLILTNTDTTPKTIRMFCTCARIN